MATAAVESAYTGSVVREVVEGDRRGTFAGQGELFFAFALDEGVEVMGWWTVSMIFEAIAVVYLAKTTSGKTTADICCEEACLSLSLSVCVL